LTQRQAYQERRVRGEDRPLRAIAPSMPDRRIETLVRLLFVVCSFFVPPLPLPSPLGVRLVVSCLLCGGYRDNIHNEYVRSKLPGINRLCGAWRPKSSLHEGCG
jgi:hypothetical protein